MNPTAPRSRTPEPPYCWQNKGALRLIRQYMEDKDQWPKVSSRLVFYLALCEMASNRGSESFICSQKSLKDLCGLSEHTQTEIIKDLKSAGVIAACDPLNGVQGQKTYTLLEVIGKIDNLIGSPPHSPCSEPTSERSELNGSGSQVQTLEVTREELEKNTPPTPSTQSSVCACDFSPGGNGSEEGNTPAAAEATRVKAAMATVETVAPKAAGGEAPPTRARRAREKPATEGRADDGGFAGFWDAYPRKVGKLAAGRAWTKLSPPPRKVHAALEAWRNSPEWLKEGGRYIPHPATWLNRGGWEDEVTAVRQRPESFI